MSNNKPFELGTERQLKWLAMLSLLACVVLSFQNIKMRNQAKPCECKCFESGYLQACEDFQNMMETGR